MRIPYYAITAALFLWSGCTSNEILESASEQGRIIEFTAYTPRRVETRSVVHEATTAMPGFFLTATCPTNTDSKYNFVDYYTVGNDQIATSFTTTSDPDNVHRWPKLSTDKMTFYALYTGEEIKQLPDADSFPIQDGKVEITVEGTSIAENIVQTDYMVAKQENATPDETVNLEFNHILTEVQVKMGTTTHKDEMQLEHLYLRGPQIGEYDIKEGKWTVNEGENSAATDFHIFTRGICYAIGYLPSFVVSEIYDSDLDTNVPVPSSVFVLPTKYTLYIKVSDYSYNYSEYTYDVDLSDYQGKRVILNVYIGDGSEDDIELNITVQDFEENDMER